MFGEVMQVWESVPTGFRPSIFKRSPSVRGFQRRYLDLGVKMFTTSVHVLRAPCASTEDWLQSPQTVERPLENVAQVFDAARSQELSYVRTQRRLPALWARRA